MPAVDPVDELAELTRAFRRSLARHAGAGAWAVPGQASTRADVAPENEVAHECATAESRTKLDVVREELGECTRCKLHSSRRSIVFGVGSAETPLMFVGEAPGEQEDKRGEPFVGRAGELLDKMIEAMGWTRESVYIANTLKCLRYNAPVQLGDGSWERIGRLVNSRYSGTVMSVGNDGTLVAKRVTGWHATPLGDRRVYRLSYANARGASRWAVGVQLTGDHPVLTDRGYVRVDELPLDARIATGVGLDDVARDVVYGTLLGDGHLAKQTAYLSFSHSEEQLEYARFKAGCLSSLTTREARFKIASGSQSDYPVVQVRTLANRALHLVRARFYAGKKCVPSELSRVLTDRMLAIWFMDDGHLRQRANRKPLAEIATCAFTKEDINVLLQGLRRLGIEGSERAGRIYFDVEQTRKLSSLLAPLVPPSMRYKLCPDVERAIPFDPDRWVSKHTAVLYERVVVEPLLHDGTDKTFYCLDVEDTHNFVTSGGVVHNCRPPGNRDPQPDELERCTPFLAAQIRAIAPRIIVALGRPAANTLLGIDAPISSLRGKFHDRNGVKVMPTFHPAYLLREPAKKREAWDDLKLVMAELQRLGIQPPRG